MSGGLLEDRGVVLANAAKRFASEAHQRCHELEVQHTALWARIAQLEEQIQALMGWQRPYFLERPEDPAPKPWDLPHVMPATSPPPAEIQPGTIMCSGQADTTTLLMNAADEYEDMMAQQPGWMP